MALAAFQLEVLRELALDRRARGESYVAGDVAINQLLAAPRLSRDIDVFHDTEDALARTWTADRNLLTRAGCNVAVVRESASFVEALVTRGAQRVLVQWTRDSAFRFFPLIEDDVLGLALHAFDLATNKVLAMTGRLEPRDWIDVLACDASLQPLGFLVWAACGKDPGYNPTSLLAEISRSHYSQAEIDALDFEGERPNAAELGRRWHAILRAARETCSAMPPNEFGRCAVTRDGELCRVDASRVAASLSNNEIAFHSGRIGGSWPTIRSA